MAQPRCAFEGLVPTAVMEDVPTFQRQPGLCHWTEEKHTLVTTHLTRRWHHMWEASPTACGHYTTRQRENPTKDLSLGHWTQLSSCNCEKQEWEGPQSPQNHRGETDTAFQSAVLLSLTLEWWPFWGGTDSGHCFCDIKTTDTWVG